MQLFLIYFNFQHVRRQVVISKRSPGDRYKCSLGLVYKFLFSAYRLRAAGCEYRLLPAIEPWVCGFSMLSRREKGEDRRGRKKKRE
jgi:hypothetical protein